MAAVTRYSCRRREHFEGCRVAGKGPNSLGNATNPRVVSGAQQTRSLRAEEPVEVVKNHEDGT